MDQVVATSPDLATSPTAGQVSDPDPGGEPAVRPGPRNGVGGAEGLDVAAHLVAATSACKGPTFTGTERASGSD